MCVEARIRLGARSCQGANQRDSFSHSKTCQSVFSSSRDAHQERKSEAIEFDSLRRGDLAFEKSRGSRLRPALSTRLFCGWSIHVFNDAPPNSGGEPFREAAEPAQPRQFRLPASVAGMF